MPFVRRPPPDPLRRRPPALAVASPSLPSRRCRRSGSVPRLEGRCFFPGRSVKSEWVWAGIRSPEGVNEQRFFWGAVLIPGRVPPVG
jgi:hypothetical protein